MKPDHLILTHIVDLRIIGGVECLFADFIQNTPNTKHHIILIDKQIHPAFLKQLQSCQNILSVHSIKWLGGFLPLPKFLRHWHLLSLVKKNNYSRVLIWNQTINLAGITQPCVYYEHGSAWYSHAHEQNQLCFGSVCAAIAISNAARQMLKLNQNVQVPVTVIRNTLKASLLRPENLVPRTLPEKEIVLGTAGRMVTFKAIPILILTVAYLKQLNIPIKAKIAGTGTELALIQSLIQKHQLENEIELLGVVDNMAEFYQQIDLFICPSVREPFGLVCLEAMLYGLPVICANIDGLPEVVANEVNGFCLQPTLSVTEYEKMLGVELNLKQQVYFPNTGSVGTAKLLDPQQIAEIVIKLKEYPELYQQMSQNALSSAQQAPSFDNFCKSILSTLENTP